MMPKEVFMLGLPSSVTSKPPSGRRYVLNASEDWIKNLED